MSSGASPGLERQEYGSTGSGVQRSDLALPSSRHSAEPAHLDHAILNYLHRAVSYLFGLGHGIRNPGSAGGCNCSAASLMARVAPDGLSSTVTRPTAS